ncbi:phospholipase/carboxylesterase [Litoreibacter halocynthiae]|uniref:Phospholipase/carboxylesterase n=1 Tax=Litoreibacter halocynthiae TaxID=1242689 RepID=A0A4R7LST6_9RHOB|nr:prolyl oligopeptidase family serine peptidase [Litoreibacter halocynthiae]TDT77892.1 phospholipase/carboxylesterase [Litoreibacter halocynthiae]
MKRVLESSRKASKSGEDSSLVIFLHGYGADGADLLGLADPLSEHLPDTVFVAPNAPEQCTGNPMGFQWFPIPWIDGSSEEESERGMMQAVEDLSAYIDATMQEEGVSEAETILVGFSQGTMMALHIAPRREDQFAGVVAFSGRLLRPELLADEAKSKPPVILIHGDQDDVVPPISMPEAGDALQEAGFPVYGHVMKGTGHGIAPDGLGVALSFIGQQLGLDLG